MDSSRNLPDHLKRNEGEMAIIRQIAESGADRPVLMLNLNRYKPDAGYPDGTPYRDYISRLKTLLHSLGARVLWQLPIHGQPVGEEQGFHEALAIWFPGHAAFAALPKAEGAAENYRLRSLCVEKAAIHRCAGEPDQGQFVTDGPGTGG